MTCYIIFRKYSTLHYDYDITEGEQTNEKIKDFPGETITYNTPAFKDLLYVTCNPTKHLCSLVPAPIWHLICINFLQLCKICIKFGSNLESKLKKKIAESAPCNGAIWDEFSVQHYHQNIKKSLYLMPD